MLKGHLASYKFFLARLSKIRFWSIVVIIHILLLFVNGQIPNTFADEWLKLVRKSRWQQRNLPFYKLFADDNQNKKFPVVPIQIFDKKLMLFDFFS